MRQAQSAIIFGAFDRPFLGGFCDHRRGVAAPAWRARGFTLIEMLVVLLLGALLTATVLPAMQRMLEAAQYKTTHDAIVGRLGELAYEAFASGRSLVLTSSAAGAQPAPAPPPTVLGTPGGLGSGAGAAPPPYPLDLPEGWAIEVERPIRFAFNGICEGGTLTLRAPGRAPEKLILAPPLCKAVPGGA
jgi:prepilin-type N-terminal cleavage/methylation domain-containing protein